MFIRREFEQGMAVVADEAMKSGMLGVISQGADGKLHALKISTADLETARVALIYVDHEKKVNLRPVADVDSDIRTGNVAQNIAEGEVCTALYGRGRGMTNQVETGFYNPGDKLTVNTTNSTLEQAGGGDPVVARVSLEWQGGKVTKDGDTLLPISIVIGGVGIGQTV